jgi:hypothetical protein
MPLSAVADINVDKVIAAIAANTASAWKAYGITIDSAKANAFDPYFSSHTTKMPDFAGMTT